MNENIKVTAIWSNEIKKNQVTDFIALQNKVFNNDYDMDRFSRKYLDNIYGPSLIIMAYDNELCVGARCFFRNDIKDVDCYQPCDTGVLKIYQGIGLFTKMTTEGLKFLKDEELIYNFPNDSSLPGYKKLGWKVIYHRRYQIVFFSVFNIELIDSKYTKWLLDKRNKKSQLFYVKKNNKYYLVKRRKFNIYYILGQIKVTDIKNLKKAKLPLLLIYSDKGYIGRGIVAVAKNNKNSIQIPIYKMDTIFD